MKMRIILPLLFLITLFSSCERENIETNSIETTDKIEYRNSSISTGLQNSEHFQSYISKFDVFALKVQNLDPNNSYEIKFYENPVANNLNQPALIQFVSDLGFSSNMEFHVSYNSMMNDLINLYHEIPELRDLDKQETMALFTANGFAGGSTLAAMNPCDDCVLEVFIDMGWRQATIAGLASATVGIPPLAAIVGVAGSLYNLWKTWRELNRCPC